VEDGRCIGARGSNEQMRHGRISTHRADYEYVIGLLISSLVHAIRSIEGVRVSDSRMKERILLQ
jgi:hypothetical protein